MSKIKVIDLLNKIANGEIPKAIIYQNIIYKYIKNEFGGGYLHTSFDNETNCEEFDWLVDDIHWDSIEDLNKEIEILEDNTEKIEELYDYRTGENDLYNDNFDDFFRKINELVRAVNQLKKEKE